jgi:ABC-2 type transport system permease protein
MMIYAKMKGFLKRDYLIESRYKLNFMLKFVNSIFPVVSFFLFLSLSMDRMQEEGLFLFRIV